MGMTGTEGFEPTLCADFDQGVIGTLISGLLPEVTDFLAGAAAFRLEGAEVAK